MQDLYLDGFDQNEHEPRVTAYDEYLLLRFMAYRAIEWIEQGHSDRAIEYLKSCIADTEKALNIPPISKLHH